MLTLSNAEMVHRLYCLKSTVQDVLVKCGVRFDRGHEEERPRFVRSGVYNGQVRERGRWSRGGEVCLESFGKSRG